MKRFQLPPKGSTIHAELMKGGICERTGHLGRATILCDAETGDFVVMKGSGGRQYTFRNYMAAIKYFNGAVGKVKALHPPKKEPKTPPEKTL